MLSALLALLLHVGLASVAATTNLDATRDGGGPGTWPRGSSTARSIQLVPWDDEPPPPPPELEQPRAERAPETPNPIVPPPEPPKPEPEIALGIEDGTEQPTPNWMGFSEATEHLARKSEVAQPQLDPDAGASSPAPSPPPMSSESGVPLTEGPEGPPGDAGSRPDRSSPVQSPASQPAPQSALKSAEEAQPIARPEAGSSALPVTSPTEHPEPPPAVPAPATAEPTEPDVPGDVAADRDPAAPSEQTAVPLHTVEPREVEPSDLNAKHPTDPALSRESLREIALAPEPSPSVTDPVAPPSAQPVDAGSEGQGGAAGQNATHTGSPANPQSGQASAPATAERSGNPGEKSPKQVDASALEDSTEVRPGRPIAAKGLEITTRRPQFSKVTRVVAYPENPVLEAKFVRDGTVRSVRLLKSSGFPDVDQPVIDAVFAWTAKGEALRKLPAAPRKASPSALGDTQAEEPGVVIKFTIILR